MHVAIGLLVSDLDKSWAAAAGAAAAAFPGVKRGTRTFTRSGWDGCGVYKVGWNSMG